LALTSPTGGGRSVGIVRSRTKATEFSFSLVYLLIKRIKSVLWRVAKRLSYIEEARCLKVNQHRQEHLKCRTTSCVIWGPRHSNTHTTANKTINSPVALQQQY